MELNTVWWTYISKVRFVIQAYSTTTKNVIQNIHIRMKLLEITLPSVYVAGFIVLTMVTGFVAIKAIPSGFAT